MYRKAQRTGDSSDEAEVVLRRMIRRLFQNHQLIELLIDISTSLEESVVGEFVLAATKEAERRRFQTHGG